MIVTDITKLSFIEYSPVTDRSKTAKLIPTEFSPVICGSVFLEISQVPVGNGNE